MTVVTGLNEIDSEFSGTTLFNTVVVIGPDGRILNRHRKLVPTNPERMIWGRGDARGLNVVDTPAGRLGVAHLLGKLHAARALRALRPEPRGAGRADLGLRRRMDRLDAPHRARGRLLT